MDHYNFYKNQAESGVGSISYHSQTGHGLGSFLARFFKSIVPFAKKGFNSIRHELVNTGIGLVGDVIKNQQPVSKVIAAHVRKIGNKLVDHAAEKIENMKGSGLKRKVSATTRQSCSKRAKKRKTAPKKKKKKTPARKKKPAASKKKKKKTPTKDTFQDIFSSKKK